jgi:hypothetical protein
MTRVRSSARQPGTRQIRAFGVGYCNDGSMVEFAGPMTRDRLQRALDEHGFDPSAYSLFGGHPSEAYVIDDRRTEWVVYYSERGLESGLASFPSEDQACRHLADLLWRDQTTRARR